MNIHYMGHMGYCDYHSRYMSCQYARRRGCVIPRFCKHFFWVGKDGAPGIKLTPRPSSAPASLDETEETACELQDV